MEGFSKIATPLHKLLQKEQQWKWTEEQQKVFDILKAKFTTNPILTTLNLEWPLRVESDASAGAILSM